MVDTKILRLVLGLVFLPGAGLAAGSAEWKLSADGFGRLAAASLYRLGDWSWSINYRYSVDGADNMMVGFNGPCFSFGHLGDAGLAAESRNPGRASLARLDERTFFRADLRSFSPSRFGLSLRGPKELMGVVLETRNGVDSFLVWSTGPAGRLLQPEILCQTTWHESDSGDDRWYTGRAGFPGGLLLSPAGRLRISSGGWTVGISVFGSLGPLVAPGSAAGLSAGWKRGPWRFRGRLALASTWYRTADGAGSSDLSGGSFDLRYRPSSGFQMALDFETGYTGNGLSIEELRTAVGWKWAGWQAVLDLDWNPVLLRPGTLAAELTWNSNITEVSIDGLIDQEGSWSIYSECEMALYTIVDMKAGFGVDVDTFGNQKWKARLRATVHTSGGMFMLDLNLNDIPESWRGGPSTAGAGDCSVRYVLPFSD